LKIRSHRASSKHLVQTPQRQRFTLGPGTADNPAAGGGMERFLRGWRVLEIRACVAINSSIMRGSASSIDSLRAFKSLR
jgi:hypothetical protein